MSCYAFCIAWLLPSQSLNGRCLFSSLYTKMSFWDLNNSSGLFPFWRRTLAPYVPVPLIRKKDFKVPTWLWRISDSRTYKFLYTLLLLKTLNLHSFRQKLAISELDKPFTPNVLSSHNIATLMSSAFHLVFNKVLACRPLARPGSSSITFTKVMKIYYIKMAFKKICVYIIINFC